MQKIIHFIKYNNTFTIILALILVSGGSAFASEDVRSTVIGETIETRTGVDNSQIISADLQNFDMSLKIENVEENDTSYIVDYSYKTMGIKDDVWQEVFRGGNLNVSKERIEGIDLGEYVAREIGELADYEIRNLKEVQNIESEKGLREQIVATTYTGLKGLIFDNETKTIDNYEPIIKEEKVELTGVFNPSSSAPENTKDDAVVIVKNTVVKQALPVNEIESVIQSIVNAELERLEKIAQENITVTVTEETSTSTTNQSSQSSDATGQATSTPTDSGSVGEELGETPSVEEEQSDGSTLGVEESSDTETQTDTASTTPETQPESSAEDSSGQAATSTPQSTEENPPAGGEENIAPEETETVVEDPVEEVVAEEVVEEVVEEETATSTPQT